MASNTVEQIFVELLLNAKGYNKDADDAIKKSEGLEQGLKKTEKQSGQTNKSLVGLADGLKKTLKGVAGLASVIAAGTGLLKLADEARKANDELNFLSKNLGMSANEVKAFQGAAAAMGGSAKGMASDMQNLNLSMNDFAMTGESSMLPMFNTLGVSMVDAQGKVRGTNDVMLDLADSMSKMDRQQGFLMGKKMGFDEGTINTLLQGRDAMQKMVDYHKQMYSSSKEELEASRKLSENQAKLGAHWESMKLMMANAIIPLLVKLSDIALKFFEFLQRHQKTVKVVFEGMAIFLGMLVIPLLGKALVAALAFIAPFAPFILVVGALAAAFVLLYDDYKVWAEGGKSLFDWGAFRDYIDSAKTSTDNLSKAFREMGQDLVRNTIPTLRGYAEIIGKLKNGDIAGAAEQSKQMVSNFSDRVTGYVDTATGHEQGTFSDKLGETIYKTLHGGKTLGGGSSGGSGGGNFRGQMLTAMNKYGITNKNERKALLAITEHETGDGKALTENSNYSYKGWHRIKGNQTNVRNWLAKHTEAEFNRLSKQDKLNIMYAGMNGNKQAGDGWKYRGRGAIQLTGRGLYQEYAKYANRPDIMSNPDLIATDQHLATDSAVWYWKYHNKKAANMARGGNFIGARTSVNGGGIGMDDYRKRLSQISDAAIGAQHAMPKTGVPASTRNSPNGGNTHNVDVKVQNINVNTTASTVTGTMNDAGNALKNNLYQFPIGIPT